MDPQTTLAPMNSKRAKEKLQDQVDRAIAGGATVAYGNEPIDLPGQFFQPTILTDIDQDNLFTKKCSVQLPKSSKLILNKQLSI